MALYARVLNGIVMDAFTPPDGFTLAECFYPEVAAQFQDATSANPQPNPGWTATQTGSAWTFAAPVPPVPTLAQRAELMIAAGCAIVSAGTPAVSKTYSLDAESRATIAEVVSGINAGYGFPGDASSFNYTDAFGTSIFPSTAVFLAVAKALRDFVYAASEVVYGRSTTLPAQPTNIS